MKKIYLVAISVAALMLAGTVAQAFADVNFSGQIRPRMETRNHDFDSDTGMNTFWQTRVRLNATAKANDQVSAFVQLQSVGVWGLDNAGRAAAGAAGTSFYPGTRVALGGAGDEASDSLADVGLHQAYFTIKDFYGTSFDLKMGRQEVVIDGHRLYGHTGWTSGAQTNDAIRLTHAAANHTLSYTFIKGLEEARQVNSNGDRGVDWGDNSDVNHHILHASTQGVLGGTLSGIFVLYDDNGTVGAALGDEWYTIGARQKGKLGALDYRVEFYHQFGDACGDACGLYTYTTESDGSSVDRDAQMFGIRVGKTFKNAQWSPTVTLWYDFLSGTDDADVGAGDYSTFDTIQDTGHKFYGFMDLYLARNGGKEGRLGLQDFAIKTKMSPKAGWIVKADWHQFWTDVDLGDNPVTAALDISGAGTPGILTLLEFGLILCSKRSAKTRWRS